MSHWLWVGESKSRIAFFLKSLWLSPAMKYACFKPVPAITRRVFLESDRLSGICRVSQAQIFGPPLEVSFHVTTLKQKTTGRIFTLQETGSFKVRVLSEALL